MGKKLLRTPQSAVDDALAGAVQARADAVTLLADHRVVVRSEHDGDAKVALVSGGGSGHEPAHVGFVGDGMLTAAVCGDVFASPSTTQVLAAIERVGGRAGVLLIVKNYTGDRLNFGLAAQRARRLGLRVQMVVVDDDCSIAVEGRRTGRRGLAGTLLVHKILGHHAALGMPLDDLVALGKDVVARLGTSSVALSGCSLPGQTATFSLGENEMELGLGIHGETGRVRMPLQDVDETVRLMLRQILEWPMDQRGKDVVLLVNNLGSLTDIELGIVTAAALKQLVDYNVRAVVAGRLMTSLEMSGVSLTILFATDEMIEAIMAPTRAPAWPGAARPNSNKTVRASPAAAPGSPSAGAPIPRHIAAALQALVDAEDLLNRLDAQVGDGDCGSTLKRCAHAILQHGVLPEHPDELLRTLSTLIERTAGGSSGVLYSIAFEAAAASAVREGWAAALDAGLSAIEAYGGASIGDRTMLDAARPACDHLRTYSSQTDWTAFVAASVDTVKRAAESTASMSTAQAGRSSYVTAEHLRGHPDPGAVAFSIWWAALLTNIAAM